MILPELAWYDNIFEILFIRDLSNHEINLRQYGLKFVAVIMCILYLLNELLLDEFICEELTNPTASPTWNHDCIRHVKYVKSTKLNKLFRINVLIWKCISFLYKSPFHALSFWFRLSHLSPRKTISEIKRKLIMYQIASKLVHPLSREGVTEGDRVTFRFSIQIKLRN